MLTPSDLTAIRRAHQAEGSSCAFCSQSWPCDAVQLANALEAQRNATLEEVLSVAERIEREASSSFGPMMLSWLRTTLLSPPPEVQSHGW